MNKTSNQQYIILISSVYLKMNILSTAFTILRINFVPVIVIIVKVIANSLKIQIFNQSATRH